MNILFLTTMYPDSIRPVTPVCHYYTKEWAKKGHHVEVITLRSMFPPIFTIMAGLFPGLARKIVGNHVEMDRDMSIVTLEKDGVFVNSMPIFKYIPHGKYPKKSINKAVGNILEILKEKNVVPDVIIGHFYNPCMEIILDLKKFFPNAKTSLVFHDALVEVVKKNYPNVKNLLQQFDVVGGRHKTMTEVLNHEFGPFKHPFVCVSGTPDFFISAPRKERVFTECPITRFIFVGQFTKNKCIKSIIQALHSAYGTAKWELSLIGDEGTDGGACIADVKSYISENTLDNNVVFLGKMPRENIIHYYDNNDCFIMISLSEAFGLVYLEAMSRGCICVGSKGQGIDGVIVDGENGFLCEGGNFRELEQIIYRINTLSSEEKKQISENAVKTASRMSDKNVADFYLSKVCNPSSDSLVNIN